MRRSRRAFRQHSTVSRAVVRARSGETGDGLQSVWAGASRSLTRRSVLGTVALAAPALGAPLLRSARAAATAVPKGKMVLAWHTNIAARWLDPQQYEGAATPYNFTMALQDALIKNFRQKHFDHLALAERYEFAEDARSATFWLRPGIKFHDGTPVTPDDVKWSYEHYRGVWAEVLHEKTQGIEIVDPRTVRFHFKRPFLDFPVLLGTAGQAGWVVPAKYYEKVGQDGFMQKPIGAGPYRLVSQQPGVKLELEAFEDYYRPVHIKNFTMLSVPEAATRIAMLERGEADIIYNIPGELIDRVRNNPKLMLAPVLAGNWWLEFPGFQNPNNPFHDKRVREAVSLALDRDAMNQAEAGGMGLIDGNWINDDVEYALQWPKWEHDLAKARRLMTEAGYPNGFNVDWVTPFPNYYSLGERIVAQLQAIGIRSKLQVMERGVFRKKQEGGLKEWPGVQIILDIAQVSGTWSNWYESMFKCGGFLGRDRNCVPELDGKFNAYLASYDPGERKDLAETVQRAILENYYFVPLYRHAFMCAIGPRIAATKWQDVFSTVATPYAYPWEDIELKD